MCVCVGTVTEYIRIIHSCVHCVYVEQLGDVRREYENAAKASQEEHTATVARLEASHAAAVTGAFSVLTVTCL